MHIHLPEKSLDYGLRTSADLAPGNFLVPNLMFIIRRDQEMMNSVANDILEPSVGDFCQETGWVVYDYQHRFQSIGYEQCPVSDAC